MTGQYFGPGLGDPTRFAPMRDAHGAMVPTTYLGASRRGALCESFLHDQMPGSVVDSARWSEHMLTALRLNVGIDVISLHGRGLRSWGLYATDITHTYPSGYPIASRWATWLHRHTTAAGLSWTSHQDDDERVYVLWGDRLPSSPGSIGSTKRTWSRWCAAASTAPWRSPCSLESAAPRSAAPSNGNAWRRRPPL